MCQDRPNGPRKPDWRETAKPVKETKELVKDTTKLSRLPSINHPEATPSPNGSNYVSGSRYDVELGLRVRCIEVFLTNGLMTTVELYESRACIGL